MKVRSLKKVLYFFLILASVRAYASDNVTVLTIESQQAYLNLSRSKLLAMKNIAHVSMSDNRAYPGIAINYTAIKLCELLKPYHVDLHDMLEFIAADNFSVLIPAKKVMSCDENSAIGYLAIEPFEKWPQHPAVKNIDNRVAHKKPKEKAWELSSPRKGEEEV